jgi:hypothetical protein
MNMLYLLKSRMEANPVLPLDSSWILFRSGLEIPRCGEGQKIGYHEEVFMKKKSAIRLALILMVTGIMVMLAVALTQEGTERRPTREKWESLTIEAVVEAVDQEKREVLLRGPEGNLVTVTADEGVQRLDEIKVGDRVNAQFSTYIKAEFRDPTEAEKAEPVVVLAGLGRAAENQPPGAVVGQAFKAVVTIEIINRPDMFVTVKGPRGNYATIPAEDRELITQLNVGEVVILTYAEAVALMLEKIK